MLAQGLVDLLGIRLAARGLHDLTDEEAEHLLLAGAELLNLFGIRRDDLGDELVDARGVGNLRETAFLDDLVDRAFAAPEGLKTSFAILPEIVPAASLSSSEASASADTRVALTSKLSRFSAPVSSPMTQFAAIFGAALVAFATASK